MLETHTILPAAPPVLRPGSQALNSRVSAARRNNFDLLRLIGALLVLVSHSFALTGRAEPAVPGLTAYGGMGLTIFFCVSGYLIAQSWYRDPRLLRFLAKRALRIFPGLAVVVALSIFVLGPAVTTLSARAYFASPVTWRYASNLWLYISYALPGVFDTAPHASVVNGSLWTLPVEFCMYLAVAGLGVVLGGLRWAYLATFAVLGVVMVVWVAGLTRPVVFLGLDARYLAMLGTFYFAGACIFAFELEPWLTPQTLTLLAFVILVTFWTPLVHTAVMWFAFTAFVIAFGRASSRLGAWVSRQGDFSYGLYIYAFPVQQTLVSVWPHPPLVPYIFAVAAITLACAIASWHIVERPALALKPRARDQAMTS